MSGFVKGQKKSKESDGSGVKTDPRLKVFLNGF